MRSYPGDTIRFQYARDVIGRHFGTDFRDGDFIAVALRKSFDPETDPGFGNGGPWGWAGYTSQRLVGLAETITDLQTGAVIWRAPAGARREQSPDA